MMTSRSREILFGTPKRVKWPSPEVARMGMIFVGDQRAVPDDESTCVIPAEKSIQISFSGPPDAFHAFIGPLADVVIAGVIFIGAQRIDPSQLRLLWSYREELEFLDLRSTGIGDAHVAQIRPMVGLRSLWLGKNENITGASMRHLRGLKEIVELRLHSTLIDDDSLMDFLPLPKLEVLEIDHTFVTDRSLDILSVCKTLRRVALFATRWSDEKHAALRRNLPSCVVSRT